jgi:Glycosyl transferase family 2
MLTISIPTYNRLEPLLHTLHQLNLQPRADECEILIVDNASAFPLEDLTRRFPEFGRLKIQVERNRGNIGLSGNLLRCMELATSEWVWVLADDDDLEENSVATVLNRIESAAEIDFILFSQTAGQSGGIVASDTREFADALDSWDRVCFISDGVYRSSRACALLNIGILYGYSVVPFLAMILIGLQDHRWKVAFEREVLVAPAHRAPNTWSLIWSTHTMTVIELVTDVPAAERLRSIARTWCLGPVGLTHDYLTRRRAKQAGHPREAFLHRLFMASRCSLKYRILAVVCWMLSMLPDSLALGGIRQIRRLAGTQAKNSRSGEQVFGQA